MTNKKSTKSALFTSSISLLLSFSMLLGTTFAWFTDTVTSANNVIKSGNLDIELDYWNGTTWETVKDASDILTGDLWEPGYVDVAYLRLKNAGSLALKYQLGVNIVSETAGKNVAGEEFKLSDYIYFDVVESNTQIPAYTRDTAMAVATETTKISTGYSKASTMEAGSEPLYLAMIVHMPTTVDNKANHNGKDIPQINLGINVFATQLTSEVDSFDNQYDADANLVKVIVSSEDELVAALADAKNGDVIGISGNVTWTTGGSHGSTPFVTNATYVTLKGVDNNATFTAVGSGVGPVGIDNGTVIFKNLKIVDNSESYAEDSWEFGYLEFRGNTVFENCNVVNAIMMEGDSAKFTNCSFNSNKDNEYAVWVSEGEASFENCSFTGARGLKVHEAYGSDVDAVSVNNSKFISLTKKPGVAIGTVNASTSIKLTNNLFAGTQAGDQGNYIYETDTDVDTFKFVEKDNTVTGAATNSNELKDSIKDNSTVYLPAGDYILPSLSANTGVTIIGADGATIGGDNTATGFGGNFGKDTTIKNLTFSGTTNGVRYSYAKGGTTTFDNCTFAGDSTYGFHIDQSNGATFIFNNCTFVGFNAFASDLKEVEFNNCTFLSNGNYGHTNIWSTGKFNNCTWGDKTSVGIRGDKAKMYFDGVEETYHHEYIGSAESLFAFAKSVNEENDSWNGQKVILVADIDLNNAVWTPIGQTGATEFKGIFDGQNYTIKNLKIDSSAKTDGHYSSGLFGWSEAGATIQNVNVYGATVVGNHNVAVIVGYTYSSKITNCHVTNAEIVCNHANDDACGDKCGIIGGYAGDESRFTNCSATNCTVKAGRDAGQLIGCGYNVSLKDGSATNVTVTATGECTGANINANLIGRVMG